MLREVKGLHGATLRARDGEIGHVDEILFDDAHWTVRYLVVDTGGWLLDRKVLIPPAALGLLDWDRQLLHVNLTRDQVEQSPAAETDRPVSRQWESEYHDYYAWPYYWVGMGIPGATWYPGAPLASPAPAAALADVPLADSHLRSTKEVTGYEIVARDGHLGHLHDFIVDDETWSLRYLAVDTRDWWPGKKVLLPVGWVGQVSWADRAVTVEVTRAQVRNGPEWTPGEPISRALEDELSHHAARQGLGAPGSSAGWGKVSAEREESHVS